MLSFLTVTDDLALGTQSATGIKQIQGMGFLALSEKGQIVTFKGPYIFGSRDCSMRKS